MAVKRATDNIRGRYTVRFHLSVITPTTGLIGDNAVKPAHTWLPPLHRSITYTYNVAAMIHITRYQLHNYQYCTTVTITCRGDSLSLDFRISHAIHVLFVVRFLLHVYIFFYIL